MADGGAGGPGSVRVTLVGKPGCHLCEDARAIVARICAEAGLAWEERSVLDDPALMDAYAEAIPVVLVDGQVAGQWHLDEGRLRARLVT